MTVPKLAGRYLYGLSIANQYADGTASCFLTRERTAGDPTDPHRSWNR